VAKSCRRASTAASDDQGAALWNGAASAPSGTGTVTADALPESKRGCHCRPPSSTSSCHSDGGSTALPPDLGSPEWQARNATPANVADSDYLVSIKGVN